MSGKSRKRKNKRPDPPPQFEVARPEDGMSADEALPEEEYALKRQRNNVAVNKTRQKKKQEEFDTIKRVKQLREENAALEKTVESLRHELNLLKEMFFSFASSSSSNRNKDQPGVGDNAK